MTDNARVLKPGNEVCHVHINNGVFVKVLLERQIFGYLKILEQIPRITRLVVVCRQHLSGHRLTEPPATGNSCETPFRKQRFVDDGYQARFVNILAVKCGLKATIPFVNVNTYYTISKATP